MKYKELTFQNTLSLIIINHTDALDDRSRMERGTETCSLNGFFYVTQALLKNMLMKRFGTVLSTSTLIMGIKGMPGQTNCTAAKGGVRSASEALTQEVSEEGA